MHVQASTDQGLSNNQIRNAERPVQPDFPQVRSSRFPASGKLRLHIDFYSISGCLCNRCRCCRSTSTPICLSVAMGSIPISLWRDNNSIFFCIYIYKIIFRLVYGDYSNRDQVKNSLFQKQKDSSFLFYISTQPIVLSYCSEALIQPNVQSRKCFDRVNENTISHSY